MMKHWKIQIYKYLGEAFLRGMGDEAEMELDSMRNFAKSIKWLKAQN